MRSSATWGRAITRSRTISSTPIGTEYRPLMRWGWGAARSSPPTFTGPSSNGTGGARPPPTARTGVSVEDNERKTQAYSGFLQNRFLIGNWTVTPGLRVEWIEHERTNRLAVGGTGVTGEDDLFELIPALGVTYRPVSGPPVF